MEVNAVSTHLAGEPYQVRERKVWSVGVTTLKSRCCLLLP